MTANKHTPGPWHTHRSGFSTVYVEARIGGGMLQEVAACGPTEAGPEQQEANARLIAAAPELLEGAEALVESIDKLIASGDLSERALEVLLLQPITHAIAKAGGAA